MQEIVTRVDNYIGEKDWKVRENSNALRSFANLQGYLVNDDIKEYGLQKIYTGEISQAHRDGFYHIHDMSHSITGYCCGYSTKLIVEEGFNCGSMHIHSSPPHHLRSLLGQLNNFIFTMSGEWAGAQALNNFDTYCAAYVRYDKLTYEEVYKELKSFVFNLNVKTRIAMQSPFTNVSIDLVAPEDIRYQKARIGDLEMDWTYAECQEEQNMFVKAFCQVMLEGDALGSILAYPIPTFCVTEDFPWGTDVAKAVFKLASETGIPYFSNFVGTNRDPSEVRSMCCRLSLDLRELVNASSGLFGAGDSTGSLGVVTLNLSRMGYMARVLTEYDPENPDDQIWDRTDTLLDEYKQELKVNLKDEYMTSLDILSKYPEVHSRVLIELESKSADTKLRIYSILLLYFLDLAKKSLVIKRGAVQDTMDAGLLPYTKRYLGTFVNHFNTIGVNAGHEMCLNLIDKGIESEEGSKLVQYTLDVILEKLSDYQLEYQGKLLFNLEASPGEGASTRLSKRDHEDFSGIITGGGSNMEYYTNSTQLPENFSTNIFDVFEHQNDIQPKYTSGTVQHVYLNEPVKDWRVTQSLIKKLCSQYRLPYISISPTVCICPICGRLSVNADYCDNYHDPEVVQDLIDRGIINPKDILAEDEETR